MPRRPSADPLLLTPSPGSVLCKDATIAYLVRAAHRALAHALQLRLAPHGVTIGMWRFLRILWERDGLSQRELSDQVGMMAPTTAVALDRMEREGLVLRVRSTADRRVVNVHLTARGKDLRVELLPLAAEVNEIACRNVRPKELALFRATLDRLIGNFADEAARTAQHDEGEAS
ncbi:DNA-binding transcriptional regulator, MarR family [Rhizobiales bacterium GAS191]|nr:DNA-binding transcriptional regulator, MarR family [Rhizobiales bacterium GAS113]SED98642.1 DNA-binding transcriptional regulator, MarR family [Rhizobiales bacterium GAS191]SEE50051.1 DNA-binding transcriptional regulator, MarR family [Rhizobiales bacterium GAS188]